MVAEPDVPPEDAHDMEHRMRVNPRTRSVDAVCCAHAGPAGPRVDLANQRCDRDADGLRQSFLDSAHIHRHTDS
jgi:hypothetical protein